MKGLLSRLISRKPAPAPQFPWKGDLVATCAHVLERDAAKRSDRTRRGNITRAAQRRAGA